MSKRMDLATPKGEIKMFEEQEISNQRRSQYVPAQTPKVGGVGSLDFSKIPGIDEADEQDEDTAREKKKDTEIDQVIGSGQKKLISPQAERARNSLAERNKAINLGENESLELPNDEFIDFMETYDGEKWFTNKDDQPFPSLDELMMHENTFNFSSTSTLKQRFNDIERQPRFISQLFPAPLHLLSKRNKRCKTCMKHLVKPFVNPTQTDPLKVNFQMIDHIVKVTIYRVQKYTVGQKEVEIFLLFRNPNRSKAKIHFYPLLDSQNREQTNVTINLPIGAINIEPSDKYISSGISVADSATTNIKELVAENQQDQEFVYKRHDNFVVLLFKMLLPDGFNIDAALELTLGF